jgi:hypothetical protein
LLLPMRWSHARLPTHLAKPMGKMSPISMRHVQPQACNAPIGLPPRKTRAKAQNQDLIIPVSEWWSDRDRPRNFESRGQKSGGSASNFGTAMFDASSQVRADGFQRACDDRATTPANLKLVLMSTLIPLPLSAKAAQSRLRQNRLLLSPSRLAAIC